MPNKYVDFGIIPNDHLGLSLHNVRSLPYSIQTHLKRIRSHLFTVIGIASFQRVTNNYYVLPVALKATNDEIVFINLPASWGRHIYIGFAFSYNNEVGADNVSQCNEVIVPDVGSIVREARLKYCNLFDMYSGMKNGRGFYSSVGRASYNSDLFSFCQGRKSFIISLHELLRVMIYQSSCYVDDVFGVGNFESHFSSVRLDGHELVVVFKRSSNGFVVDQRRIGLVARYFLDQDYQMFWRAVSTNYFMMIGAGKELSIPEKLPFPPFSLNNTHGRRAGMSYYITQVDDVSFINKLPIKAVRAQYRGAWYKFRVD